VDGPSARRWRKCAPPLVSRGTALNRIVLNPSEGVSPNLIGLIEYALVPVQRIGLEKRSSVPGSLR
jgi:hypothetical protein